MLISDAGSGAQDGNGDTAVPEAAVPEAPAPLDVNNAPHPQAQNEENDVKI